MYDFSGKTAVVTGASRGIGEATARYLDACGARVVLVARSEETMNQIASELNNDPLVIASNLANEESVMACVEQIKSNVQSLDILVNNAGMGWFEPPEAITAKALDLQLNLNLRNIILMTSVLGELLLESKGAVINISSMAYNQSGPLQAVYAATKGGLNGFTFSLGRTWAAQGVRVNGIAPGLIHTPIWDHELGTGDDAKAKLDALAQQGVPAGRAAKPQEVATVVAFLASDDASYINAQVINVDGGMISR